MLNVLIADDHAIFRKGLREILAQLDPPAAVAEAADGARALALGLEQAWDLVILDISMPGLSGMYVLMQLKRARPAMPVLMVSMHASWPYVQGSLRAGADGYLTKDSAPVELVAAIHTVLAGGTYVAYNLRKGSPEVDR